MESRRHRWINTTVSTIALVLGIITLSLALNPTCPDPSVGSEELKPQP
jgi:hypothetical protein